MFSLPPLRWRPRPAAASGFLAVTAASPGLIATDVVAEHLRSPTVVVTATRERALLVETPASIGTVSETTIREVRPTHPSQLLSQVPGVAVGVTNGEGHTTAIRQGFTTNPVYLFLEDGIPTRSTGFFNHNALYEINVPQSGGIEVTRGPGSALYGSDAIGGIVNVLTAPPPTGPMLSASLERGTFGWTRLLVSGGTRFPDDGVRADLNLTSTDGWRNKTAYDRQSGTFRWDRALGDAATLRTVLSFSNIDQETGANSPLVLDDYRRNPGRNNFPIAFRKVQALRLYSSYERTLGNSLLTFTPYFRDDSMDLLASFTLSSDPTVFNTSNKSYGFQAKWRTDLEPMRTRIIAGVDVDVSPGSRTENRLNVTVSGTGASRVFSAYTEGPRIYDYEVTYRGISPYVHAETSPTDRLRVTAGLRFDRMSYRFDNRFDATPVSAGGRFYGQAADTSVEFSRLSPKLGATYRLAETMHAFASYNTGFRAPSEGQLFRPSSATTLNQANATARSALGLDPIVATQLEIGLRGDVGEGHYSVALYDLRKKNDIVSFRDTATNLTETVNAGRTRHRGIEVGLDGPLCDTLSVATALSYARHSYEEWLAFNAGAGANANFSGKEIESSPRVIGNTRLRWTPQERVRVEFEWITLGSYWMDQANTVSYGGHDLFNARAHWRLHEHLALFANLYNLTDRRYADSASISSSTPVYSPGLPRTLYAGVEVSW